MTVRIEDIMVRDVLTVDAQSSVYDTTVKMNDKDVGCVVVVSDGEAVGILTERDILSKIVVEKRDAEKTRVGDVMSTPLVTGRPDMSMEDAIKVMVLNRVKKLPLLEEGRLVGIVTLFDIVRWEPIATNILRGEYETREPPRNIKKYVIPIK
ncbi:MAG: CBS domain-containing protein [Candidatus Freyarchaeota archaeon]